jgi:hypothetical protein
MIFKLDLINIALNPMVQACLYGQEKKTLLKKAFY